MLIDIPTHVSGESKTTIAHVITNDIHNVIYPCLFLSDISDHFPAACLVAGAPKSSTGMPKNNNTKENYMYRDTSHFDPDQFKMTLSQGCATHGPRATIRPSRPVNVALDDGRTKIFFFF